MKCVSYRISHTTNFALAPAGVGSQTKPYELTEAGAFTNTIGPCLAELLHGLAGSGWARFLIMKVKMSDTNRIVGAIGGESPTNGANYGVELTLPFRAEVTIEGTAPFLFHRWNCESVESKSKAKKGSAEKKSDDVESYVYRNDKGELCIPGEYLRGAIVAAAKYRQDPRSPRKSACDLFKACIISLTPLASLGVKEWDYMDKRRVVIQRSAITRNRPAMAEGWKVTFIFMVNLPEYVDPAMLNETIQSAGKLIGIGDFRPSFGRFNVTKFSVLTD